MERIRKFLFSYTEKRGPNELERLSEWAADLEARADRIVNERQRDMWGRRDDKRRERR